MAIQLPTGRVRVALVIGGVLVALWVGFLVWRVATAPQKAADAKAGQILAESHAAAGADAVGVTANRATTESNTDTTTRTNTDAIRKATGADAPVDPAVAAAGRRGLCLYAQYAHTPECVQLARPAGVAAGR